MDETHNGDRSPFSDKDHSRAGRDRQVRYHVPPVFPGQDIALYNPATLARIAWTGLKDMGPSLRSAFGEARSSERLQPIYGLRPRTTIVVLAIVFASLGEWFARSGPKLPFGAYLDWPAVFVALVFALLIRRYLFRARPSAEDFSWLAASLIPAALICVILSPVISLLFGAAPRGDLSNDYRSTPLGQLLMWLTDELGILAAFTIALAALCYSREWPRAVIDLAVRLLVFRIMIWVTALVLIEIGIVGQLIGTFLNMLFGWTLPAWMKVLADQISYASLLTVAYLAIIGGTWTVCKASFAALLDSGHVDVVTELEKLTRSSSEAEDDEDAQTEPP